MNDARSRSKGQKESKEGGISKEALEFLRGRDFSRLAPTTSGARPAWPATNPPPNPALLLSFSSTVHIPRRPPVARSGHAMPIDLWPTFQISVSGFTAREGGCLKLPRITAFFDPSRKIKESYSDGRGAVYSSPVNEWSPCGANHYLFLYTCIDVSEKEHGLPLPPSFFFFFFSRNSIRAWKEASYGILMQRWR